MSPTHEQVLDRARELMNKEAKASLGKRLKRGAILGSFGLASIAAGRGAAQAVKQDANRPLAPVQHAPPGY